MASLALAVTALLTLEIPPLAGVLMAVAFPLGLWSLFDLDRASRSSSIVAVTTSRLVTAVGMLVTVGTGLVLMQLALAMVDFR